jgi:hypothetical protein
VLSLCDYHYEVKQLDDEPLKSILEECVKFLLEDKQILYYIADTIGLALKTNTNSIEKRNVNKNCLIS